MIKIDQAQMQSHIHQLYELSDTASSEKVYIVGTLKRTIPLGVMQTPHSRTKESLLNGCRCTAQYSQIFTSKREAKAYLQQVNMSSSKSLL